MKKKNSLRKDNRILIQVYTGLDPKTGKKQYVNCYGATQAEADGKADDLRLRLRKGLNILAQRDTFGAWADRWMSRQKATLAEKQYKNYIGYVTHLKNALDIVPIAKVLPADFEDLIGALAAENPYTHRPTAKKTLTDIRGTAYQIMQYAIDNRVLDYNPVGPVRVPKNSPQSHRRALTDEEQQWIINTPHRAQRAAMIMMYAGLRRGELIPLTWNDIDLAQRTIKINKSVAEIGGKMVVKPMTKTAAGMRTIDIPQRLVDFLRAEQDADKAKRTQGKVSVLNALVCPASSGNMLSSSSWKSMWNSYLTDLNFKYGNQMDRVGKLAKSKYNSNGVERTIPNITAHWLRHTFATLLYLSGVDILTAKAQLGHSDVKTTLQIYTHLDSIYKRNSMNKLDEYLLVNTN